MLTSLVVTSINPPTAAVRELAEGCLSHGWDFLLAGDTKSPTDFALEGCRFLSLDEQRKSGFELAVLCPERTYARKNFAYLEAMRSGAQIIVETDDDNHPLPNFWEPREIEKHARAVNRSGWVNAYGYFSENFIYPRGLPLPHARETPPTAGALQMLHSPIQQGLADSDPDVDAVYRMLFPLPFDFEIKHDPVCLTAGAWCPFNSQNTTFFKSAFPLLYLPAHCSFRMTDIWRSFIAQRILHSRGLGILFLSPTVRQDRNDHDLHRDFTDEIPGYAHNAAIREALEDIPMDGTESTRLMMERCYERMMERGWIGRAEESLIAAWFRDLNLLGIQ